MGPLIGTIFFPDGMWEWIICHVVLFYCKSSSASLTCLRPSRWMRASIWFDWQPDAITVFWQALHLLHCGKCLKCGERTKWFYLVLLKNGNGKSTAAIGKSNNCAFSFDTALFYAIFTLDIKDLLMFTVLQVASWVSAPHNNSSKLFLSHLLPICLFLFYFRRSPCCCSCAFLILFAICAVYAWVPALHACYRPHSPIS